MKNTAISLLQDAQTYLEQIDKGTYQKPIELLSQATIGQHTRHFIEFFECLFSQLDGEQKSATVNYDLRRRNPRIEREPTMAIAAITEIIERIRSLKANPVIHLQGAYQVEPIDLQSNYLRELVYNIEHTIHHLAIIKIGLKLVAPQITLPPHFGVAASTVKFQQASCAQ